jgi:hypothetical protein
MRCTETGLFQKNVESTYCRKIIILNKKALISSGGLVPARFSLVLLLPPKKLFQICAPSSEIFAAHPSLSILQTLACKTTKALPHTSGGLLFLRHALL